MNLEIIYENKELLKITYALLLLFICALIVLRTDRLFKLSDHQGLRYFRNSFFFAGAAFVFRFMIYPSLRYGSFLAISTYEFFILVASFSLLYSLTWKTLGPKKNHHSFLNIRMVLFYLISLAVVIIDLFLKTNMGLSLLQTSLFLIMIFVSYRNYFLDGKNYFFLGPYFFAILTGFSLWVFTFYISLSGQDNSFSQILFYGLNLLFFLIFFIGTMKVIKDG